MASDLYLDFQGENYGLQQIKGILLQFYAGLIEYLDEVQASVPKTLPPSIGRAKPSSA